ncbi:MAG: ester cyclase [Acidobacteriota bacterium]
MDSAKEQTTADDNKALLRRWFDEVWNKGRAEAIDEMFSADGIAHGLADTPENTLRGPAGFKPFHETFRGAFPDVEVVVEDMIAEGDKVVARCSVRARHSGDHLGIAASNSPVAFTGIAIVRIENGKIVEAWNNFDFMTMNKQIGAI